jgi:putative ABC transport system permease protein
MLTNYLKIAFRNLQRNKVYSFINVTGLALGLACTILISLWVYDELSYDKFHTNGPQLYRVMANTHWGDVSTFNMVPGPLNEALKKDIPEVERVTSLTDRTILITAGNTSFKEKGYYSSPDILSMFSFPLLKGNKQIALSSPDNIVISEKLAQKYFGDSDAVGKTLKIDDRDIFKISAVMKDIPAGSSLQFDWLIPFEVYEKSNPWLKTWGNFSVSMFVMLKPNTCVEKVNDRLKNFLKTKNGEDNKDEIFLQAYQDMYLYSDFKNGVQDGGRIEYVKLFTVVAFFVLLIACINFMNLSTARSSKRAKEVGIRKAIGAERKMIFTQFMGEATLLTCFAVSLSMLLVWIAIPYFNQLTSKQLSFNLADPSVLILILSVTAITVFLSGSYPALFLSSFKPVSVLKASVIKDTGSAFLRRGLVVVQFTLSVFLLIGTLVIYKQIQYIKSQNLGIDKENLVEIPINRDISKHSETFLQELSRSPAIRSIALTADNPIDISGSSGDLDWEGKKPGQLGSISATWVGYDYLKTVGVPLIEGRDFDRSRPDSANYLINETAAKMMGIESPVGKTVSFWNGTGQIIGVIKDFHLQSLHLPITPLILALQPENSSYVLVRTEPGQTAKALADLQKIYGKFNSAFPFEYHFMDEIYEQRYKSEIIIGQLGTIFAVLTIFISCLGLFGLAAFTAEQRIKEIGIRKVLGATVANIAALLSGDFLKLVLLSLLVAIPASLWAMNKWLQSFAYHIDMPWWIFFIAGALAVLIALATVSVQAIRAAVANPVESLRSE